MMVQPKGPVAVKSRQQPAKALKTKRKPLVQAQVASPLLYDGKIPRNVANTIRPSIQDYVVVKPSQQDVDTSLDERRAQALEEYNQRVKDESLLYYSWLQAYTAFNQDPRLTRKERHVVQIKVEGTDRKIKDRKKRDVGRVLACWLLPGDKFGDPDGSRYQLNQYPTRTEHELRSRLSASKRRLRKHVDSETVFPGSSIKIADLPTWDRGRPQTYAQILAEAWPTLEYHVRERICGAKHYFQGEVTHPVKATDLPQYGTPIAVNDEVFTVENGYPPSLVKEYQWWLANEQMLGVKQEQLVNLLDVSGEDSRIIAQGNTLPPPPKRNHELVEQEVGKLQQMALNRWLKSRDLLNRIALVNRNVDQLIKLKNLKLKRLNDLITRKLRNTATGIEPLIVRNFRHPEVRDDSGRLRLWWTAVMMTEGMGEEFKWQLNNLPPLEAKVQPVLRQVEHDPTFGVFIPDEVRAARDKHTKPATKQLQVEELIPDRVDKVKIGDELIEETQDSPVSSLYVSTLDPLEYYKKNGFVAFLDFVQDPHLLMVHGNWFNYQRYVVGRLIKDGFTLTGEQLKVLLDCEKDGATGLYVPVIPVPGDQEVNVDDRMWKTSHGLVVPDKYKAPKL